MIPEYHIFLGLADNEVFYADLDMFMIMGHLPRSRGASGFAVDWLTLRKDLRLSVASKKKIVVFKWEKNTFTIKVSPNTYNTQTPLQGTWDQISDVHI